MYGQTNVPAVNNAVAVAAGESHSLALLDTGRVLAWGCNAYGQREVPDSLTGVVAIAAHKNHSLALKADGMVVAWGCDTDGQTSLPADLSNVVAMAAGARHNVFLTAEPGGGGDGEQEFVRSHIPSLVTSRWLSAVYADLYGYSPLLNGGPELSGAKALIRSVLEVGLPYTMEEDDVLHGFFYGTEPLADLGLATNLFSLERQRLVTTPKVQPMLLEEVVWPRVTAFANRLNERLQRLKAPEIPRMLGHTLRLLRLLQDAYGTGSASTPPPALETWSEGDAPRLVLYGEPYAHYILEYADSLIASGWSTATTNCFDGAVVNPPVAGGPERFYRGFLPPPELSF